METPLEATSIYHKPIMQVKIERNSKPFCSSQLLGEVVKSFRKTFGDKYDIIFTTSNINISTSLDNVDIVNIDKDTKIDDLKSKLDYLWQKVNEPEYERGDSK